MITEGIALKYSVNILTWTIILITQFPNMAAKIVSQESIIREMDADQLIAYIEKLQAKYDAFAATIIECKYLEHAKTQLKQLQWNIY